MSREIAFRAWDGKRMYDGDDIVGPSEEPGLKLTHLTTYRLNEYFRQFPLTLMQYTGLQDKNGTDIYEGDIISNGSEKFLVVYGKEVAGFCWSRIDNPHKCDTLSGILKDMPPWAVLGNRYENPDLLEGRAA